jgi:hypothetical protein
MRFHTIVCQTKREVTGAAYVVLFLFLDMRFVLMHLARDRRERKERVTKGRGRKYIYIGVD